MPSRVKSKDQTPALAVANVSRKPQQGRSKASLERMLAAGRELMLERGSEEFTLQDVSERGQVSIGSIYLRFESKDNLVRGVIAEALDALAADETALMNRLTSDCADLTRFMPAYVEGYAEILRRHAPLLRLTMERAAFDPLVSAPGKQHALRAEAQSTEAMLAHSGEFGGSDHKVKAQSAYHIIFATLARQLSLGSSGEAAHDYDWSLLKRELGRMCLAYLRAE
ncbi:TetR/AcrR family transcriptional regulator [Novosphingobium sp. B 225]|uniref:TetR/AcrR family transcriptional regulator n=1 Tax=Novosphingobium sp. B 225 TaxID=1961849 RepID=UPI000B4B2184|nr:TetR/AcrR family transcriptional regulator [Novosphingobium sp. B 225]